MSEKIYAAVTAPGCEIKAMADLLKRGLLAYTPAQVRWRSLGSGRVADTQPVAGRVRHRSAIFARYVFVLSDDIGRDFPAIRGCRYVTGIMGVGGAPRALGEARICRFVPVDERCEHDDRAPDAGEWLARFLIVQTLGFFDYTRERKPKMSVGQAVRVLGGAFMGYLATVREVRKREVVVELQAAEFHKRRLTGQVQRFAPVD